MARHADIVIPSTCRPRTQRPRRRDERSTSSSRCIRRSNRPTRRHATTTRPSPTRRRPRRTRLLHRRPDGAAWLAAPLRDLATTVAADGDIRRRRSSDFWQNRLPRTPYVVHESWCLFDDFRAAPGAHRFDTASGKIEIVSDAIAGFDYPDCPGHPIWLEPVEWLGEPRRPRPLPAHPDRQQPQHPSPLPTRSRRHLASLQDPRSRTGPHPPRRRRPKRHLRRRGRPPLQRPRRLSRRRRHQRRRPPGVVQLSTGAWYDPLDPADPNSMCVHGNPNVLTRDAGTSRLAQGCAGQHSHVQLEPWTNELPPIRAYDPPLTIVR